MGSNIWTTQNNCTDKPLESGWYTQVLLWWFCRPQLKAPREAVYTYELLCTANVQPRCNVSLKMSHASFTRLGTVVADAQDTCLCYTVLLLMTMFSYFQHKCFWNSHFLQYLHMAVMVWLRFRGCDSLEKRETLPAWKLSFAHFLPGFVQDMLPPGLSLNKL